MPSSSPASATSITFASHRTETPDLRFVHYNDVYHIEPGSAEPVGGIARFQTVMNEYRYEPQYVNEAKLITLFSGDAFNPSLESSVTKGRHMVPFLNKVETDVSVVGNHDLDFGVVQFQHLRNQCNFPWLLANLLDPALGENVPLAGCDATTILTSSNGIKIGVIGLIEREWIDTINSLPPNLIYKSASATAMELAPKLREQGCEMIIGLTHMREPNDMKLAEKTLPGTLDLIVGGHDHFYNHALINSTHVLRSNTDFKSLSYIEAWKQDCRGWDFTITRRDIVRAIPEDSSTVQLVGKLSSSLKSKLEKPIGYTAAPLDGRFTTVRTRESNLGNFVCDLMRYFYNTDCALIASGTIRGDQVYPPGVLRLKDILNCFPFEDPCVVLRVSGQDILDALENSVRLVPALEGRFPQVSNIVFEYDPDGPAGSRVRWIQISGEDLEKQRKYTVATRGYMARGKDGFESLLAKSEGGTAEELVSEENGVLISLLLRQYFMSVKILGRWKRFGESMHRHWEGVHSQLHQGGMMKEATEKNSQEKSSDDAIRRQVPIQVKRGEEQPKRGPDGDIQHQELVDSDSDGEHGHHIQSSHTVGHPLVHIQSAARRVSVDESDRLYHLARSYAKKWMRLAEINRADIPPIDEAEPHLTPTWTKGIAPKVEGRIRITGQWGTSDVTDITQATS